MKLDLTKWREGHYLPDGTVECRVVVFDKYDKDFCAERLLIKYPSFEKFTEWVYRQDITVKNLDVRGCDLKGVKFPEGVENLDVSFCDLKGVKFPEGVENLYARFCDLKGVKFPEGVKTLNVSWCDLKGVKFPEGVENLDVRGCYHKGVKFPKGVKIIY
ncbi:MAG: hypothetical protein KC517_09385 [Bacteroidetes bacterium]|nr:hypothetical protein [Bacteroidota bacterium]